MVIRFDIFIGPFDVFVSRIRKGLFKTRSTILSATCRRARLASSPRRSKALLPEPALFTNTGVCACDAGVAAFAATTLRYMSSATDAQGVWPSLRFATVTAFAAIVVGRIVSTDCEFQGTSLCSGGKIFWMYLLTNVVPNNISTAALSTVSNLTRMRNAPMCGCKKTPSELTGRLFAILSSQTFGLLMRDIHVGCRNNLLATFGLASMSIRYFTWVISWDCIPLRRQVW